MNQKNKTPGNCIILVFILDALICSLPLLNSYAYAAITGITTIGYFIINKKRINNSEIFKNFKDFFERRGLGRGGEGGDQVKLKKK